MSKPIKPVILYSMHKINLQFHIIYLIIDGIH